MCVWGGGHWTGRGEYEIFQQESQGLMGRARNKNPTLSASLSLILWLQHGGLFLMPDTDSCVLLIFLN